MGTIGRLLSQDDEGTELPDLQAVQRELGRSVTGMAKDELIACAESGQDWSLIVEVRSETGLVMRAKFSFEMERLQ